MSEIDVSKYFKNYRNEYGLTFAIEYIGNPKDLIREIKQQNELLISYKEENEELKQGVKVSMEWTSDCCKVCTFKKENEELNNYLIDAEKKLKQNRMLLLKDLSNCENEKYKLQQKLEKIKKYIKQVTKRSDKALLEFLKADDNYLTKRGIAFKYILQIIEGE